METLKQTQDNEHVLEENAPAMEPFGSKLAKDRLELSRGETDTLQINVGLECNQTCLHCHLNAGPGKQENMDAETAKAVIAYAERCRFEVIDITGGAPELNLNLPLLIEGLAPLASKVMLRSNLSVLNDGKRDELYDLLKKHRVAIVASFPSLNENQADSQRGDGIFQASITAFQKLNSLGWGREGTGLELDLVSNPTGAFLPPSQSQTEKRFKQMLMKKWGITFNNLYNFANVPLGRFRKWLIKTGNLDSYLQKLADAFNDCALEGLMCRKLVSISWDGFSYDCDFNLACGLPMGGRKTHVSEIKEKPDKGSSIAVSDHCYTCTAGSGFT